MSWSGLQRDTLEAMGFTVLLPRPSAGGAGTAAQGPGDTRDTPTQHAAPAHAAVAAPSVSDPAASQRAEPRPAAATQDRLARALLRAAGRAPDAVDAAALLSQWPETGRLRRDPAAKRALWPRLRALRRADA